MLTVFNPWTTIARDLDWFSRSNESDSQTTTSFVPRLDILEEADHYRIDIDLPGVEAKDVSVTVERNVLTISGERKLEKEDKREGYYRLERLSGSFTRAFELPKDVDPENISAASKNGVLSVSLPKSAVAKARSIEVKTLS